MTLTLMLTGRSLHCEAVENAVWVSNGDCRARVVDTCSTKCISLPRHVNVTRRRVPASKIWLLLPHLVAAVLSGCIRRHIYKVFMETCCRSCTATTCLIALRVFAGMPVACCMICCVPSCSTDDITSSWCELVMFISIDAEHATGLRC